MTNKEYNKTKPINTADAYMLDSAALSRAARGVRGRYQPLQPNAYREPLLKSLEDAFHAVMVGDLNQTKMVRFNHRSQNWELRFGIGKRCVRLETDDTSATEDLEFYNIKDLLAALQELHKRTKRGDYDDALNRKLKQRQDHALKMLSKRKTVGFKLLTSPTTSFAHNNVDTNASTEETWNDLKPLGNPDHSYEEEDLEAAE
jgi:hypothetical protein